MNNKIKSLIFETVSEVLLEGRLEDVKAKYPEDKAGEIDRLSQGDPSGNNKYLAWMADQYIRIGGSTYMDMNELIDLVTRFHKLQARITPAKAKEVVASNPSTYDAKQGKKVSNNPKDISSYSSFEGLKKVVDVLEEDEPISNDRNKIYQDDKWTVIVPKTHEASCKYGVHSNWCVSTSNPHYFKDYTSRGMLAFVLWRGKQEGQIPMSKEGDYKVAAYINYERPSYQQWEWFNKKDNRMDNDLLISILPPALIQSINNHVRVAMKESGYLVEIDEEELNEKTYPLLVKGPEGRRKFITMLKPNSDYEWLNKYSKPNNRLDWVKSNDWTQKLLFFTVSEPNGNTDIGQLDLGDLYRRLRGNKFSGWRPISGKEIFKNSLPYSFNDELSTEKVNEIFEFTKDYFNKNYKGYQNIETTQLQVGDVVRWERATRNDRRTYGRYKQGKILKQTPSGYFVVQVEGEDKTSRFKPDYGKYMEKQFDSSNIDMSVWDFVPEEQQ